MNVPFLDLKAQYEQIRSEVAAAMQQVLEKTAFAGGPFVAQFEKEFAPFCQCAHAVGVGNGTDALWLALLALGVGPGDEVITVPNTFIATLEAISYCGARPVLVDIDDKTCNLNPALLERAISSRTKAIMPVHLFGQMADMDPIMEIARRHKLFVVEDASQAHGAEYKSRRAGSIGQAGCFSFYPGKNLGAYGEAGAVVTSDQSIAGKISMLREHGQSKKYYHDLIGWNCRMDGLQGAILSVKLKHLPQWTEARRRNAQQYNDLLQNMDGLVLPVEAPYARHVYHIYPVRIKKRDQLMSHLSERGIACGIHYPVPIHLTEAYRGLGYKPGDFPIAEKCAAELVSLPMFPELTGEQIAHVAEGIREFVEKR